MGKTSTAAKNRWNKSAYDQIPLRVPKGRKDEIQAFAEAQGKSTNAFILEAINEKMERESLNPL